jgi:hypothetical protein
MRDISDKELKAQGIAAIASHLDGQSVAIVTAGEDARYVVMDVAHYHYLRDCEREAAISETRADLESGRAVRESPEAHLRRIDKPNESTRNKR